MQSTYFFFFFVSHATMSTIQNVSDETLMMLFKELNPRDLQQCQKVCRSWYRPAHLVVLQDIFLHSVFQIAKFISSIKHNPKPLYLHQVKTIHVSNVDFEDLDKVNVKDGFTELLFQFRNLKELHIRDSVPLFGKFDNKLSELLLNFCPKLDTVKISTEIDQFIYLYNMRVLLTEFDMNRIGDRRVLPSLLYLGRFPRINKIIGVKEQLDNFQKLLSFVYHLPALKDVTLRSAVEDQENFAENYLSSRTEDEQAQILKTLSKITRVTIEPRSEAFGVQSIKFIHRYFSGLKYFYMSNHNDTKWTNLHQRVFCGELLDIYRSTTDDKSSIYLQHVPIKDLIAILPSVTQKAFSSPSKTRILQIDMTDMLTRSNKSGGMYIKKGRTQSEKCVRLMVPKQPGLQGLDAAFFAKLPVLENVDVFELNIEYKNLAYSTATTIDMYDRILKKIPTAKKLFLDVPASYKDIGLLSLTHPQVQDLTLQITAKAQVEILLNTLFLKFPNLKRFNLHYFSGTWNQYAGEFRIRLQHSTLDKLEVDVSPVLATWKNYPTKKELFVIEIFSRLGTRFFVVSYDLKSLVERNARDFQNLECGVDYYKVVIDVGMVERLDICMYADMELEPEYEMNYTQLEHEEDEMDRCDVSRLTIFDDSVVTVD